MQNFHMQDSTQGAVRDFLSPLSQVTRPLTEIRGINSIEDIPPTKYKSVDFPRLSLSAGENG